MDSDADDGLSGVEITFSMDDGEEDEQDGNETETGTNTSQSAATPQASRPLIQGSLQARDGRKPRLANSRPQ